MCVYVQNATLVIQFYLLYVVKQFTCVYCNTTGYVKRVEDALVVLFTEQRQVW